ncbi:hypothetical protein FMM58_02525 [Campylobacter sp. LR291e]|uniref:hypothetical protein n=1 Tax=Campylobacter sp. LR291e TaxID=2593546 RepID=UPI001239528F|nr:hypothetical protein [Campylobacter sp. LR291e]KAA6231498.1 hypothetical protein FMM58_02525 [Campylobacter sp. LR291e]
MQINYKKYLNMSEIQLLNSLLSIDEKVEKLKISTQEKLKDFNKLRKFLRTQLKIILISQNMSLYLMKKLKQR